MVAVELLQENHPPLLPGLDSGRNSHIRVDPGGGGYIVGIRPKILMLDIPWTGTRPSPFAWIGVRGCTGELDCSNF